MARKYVNITVYCQLVRASWLETAPQTFKIYLVYFSKVLISSKTWLQIAFQL